MKDNEKIKKLSDLLERQTLVENLPPPDDVSREAIDNVQLPPPDNKIYIYKDLVKKLELIPELPKIPTFIPQLDYELDGGFQGGELAIISGIAKHGKSTLMQTMSYLQSRNAFPSIVFSLEMNWQELIRKFMLMDQNKKSNEPTDLPIFSTIDNRLLSLDWLEEKIKEAQKKHYIACVYIDHLHYLISLKEGNSKNIPFLLGSLARELKRMSMRLQIPIVLLAHTKKIDINVNPDLNALRDSGMLANEADFVIFIWRKKEKQDSYEDKGKRNWQHNLQSVNEGIVYSNESVLSLEANRRNGKTKRIGLVYYKNRFYPKEEYDNIINFNIDEFKDKMDWTNK